jgi:hypothetical protein
MTAFTRRQRSSQLGEVVRAAAANTAASAAPAPPSEPPTPAEASSVPVIPVDSLPVAARSTLPKGGTPVSASASGSGRIFIAASPGWCSVVVDGVGRGVTPLAGLELAVGTHKVECVPPTGKPHGTSIAVTEGSVTRHKFALDE